VGLRLEREGGLVRRKGEERAKRVRNMYKALHVGAVRVWYLVFSGSMEYGGTIANVRGK
jgi:hypothetical protein